MAAQANDGSFRIEWAVYALQTTVYQRGQAQLRTEKDTAGITNVRPRVVFLCVHNAGRSQMAAGFMTHIARGSVDVYSGGSDPAAIVNPVAVAAMAERGIDIGTNAPQAWDEKVIRSADTVVTMGCGDTCPVFPGKRYVDWELDDPAGKPIEEVRRIRDDIEQRVRALVDELTPGS